MSPTATFTITTAVISPVVPVDPDFMDLMEHLSDFQRMARGTATSGSYGHKTTSRTLVSQTYPDVRSRFRSLTEEEIEATGRQGEVIDDYVLYVPIGYLPELLKDQKNVAYFQVVNIRRLNGIPEDPGPFDIQGVRLMAGEDHHYQVRLLRVRS